MIKDGDWILMSADPVSGKSTWMLPDGDGRGNPVIRTSYPVDALLAENTAVRNEARKAWTGDYHRIASIPLNKVFDQNLGLNEAFMQGDDKYTSRWLNDPDNRAWRTKEGRV